MGLAIESAGWMGAGALLAGYVLVSWGRLAAHGWGFQLLNIVGATGLIINGVWHAAWPSVGLNTVWILVGFVALRRMRQPAATACQGSESTLDGHAATTVSTDRHAPPTCCPSLPDRDYDP